MIPTETIMTVALMIDAECFSEEVRAWERGNPGHGIWGERRQRAVDKAHTICVYLTEGRVIDG